MGTCKYKAICFLVILLIINQISIAGHAQKEIQVKEQFTINNGYVILNTFPINLSKLFWEDDNTVQTQFLDLIGNTSSGWVLTPWGGHFVSNHIEGADKWYFYAQQYLEIYAPHDGTLIHELQIGNGTVDNIKGNDVIIDVGIYFDIGGDCAIGFGHVNLLKSISDVIESTNTYNLVEGEFIGYTPGPWALDFMYYSGENFKTVCPYPALSTSLQNEIDSLFDLQYQRAKISGIHPESNLCNDYYIHYNDTVWGVWDYKSSQYDSLIDKTEDWGRYEISLCTFLNRDFTNPETFYRNPINTNYNLSIDNLGLFSDNIGGEDLSDYDSVGQCLIELVSGNSQDGIFKLSVIGYSDWGASNTTVYAKYHLTANNAIYEDDELVIEYFDNLLAAEGEFTSNQIEYTRFIPSWDMTIIHKSSTTPTDNSSCIGQIILAIVFSTIIIIRKKRKVCIES